MRLAILSEKFKDRTQDKYLERMADWILENCSYKTADLVLKNIESEFDRFPTIAQIAQRAKMIRMNEVIAIKPMEEKPWVSKKAPGTPASIEALFLMIEVNKTESKAFKFGQKFTGLDDEILWECYQNWQDGKIHPRLKNYRERSVTGIVNAL